LVDIAAHCPVRHAKCYCIGSSSAFAVERETAIEALL
jgi:hypothetical protein